MSSPSSLRLHWISDLSEWSGDLPAALVLVGAAPQAQRKALRDLVAGALKVEPSLVEIEKRENRRPKIAAPAGVGLSLSSTTRGDVAALAVAEGSIGVDAEQVDMSGEVPWLVLHPDERLSLEALLAPERAPAFARLWSLKEAYLKALAVGFNKPTETFAIRLAGAQAAVIEDSASLTHVLGAQTRWVSAGERLYAVSAVWLEAASVR